MTSQAVLGTELMPMDLEKQVGVAAPAVEEPRKKGMRFTLFLSFHSTPVYLTLVLFVLRKPWGQTLSDAP